MTTNTDIEYALITILIVLLYVLPIVLTLKRIRHKMSFSLTKIKLLFNYSLISQIGLGFLLYFILIVFGGNIFGSLTRTNWFELISVSTLWYCIIGVFYYIPAVIVLNLAIGMINLVRKNKQSARKNSHEERNKTI